MELMRSILLTLLVIVLGAELFAQGNLDSCLLSFYEFDNQTIADSRGSNNGQLISGAFGIDHFGNSDAALKIDGQGSDDIVAVPHTLIDPNNDFGISFWVKLDSFNTSESLQYLVTSRNDASGNEQGGVSFSVNTSGEVTCDIRTTVPSATAAQVRSSPITTCKWHHIVVTKNNTTLDLYIDDNLEASTMFTTTVPVPTYWNFGATYNPSNPAPFVYREMAGRLDDIRFYCRGLTTTDITALYDDNVCIGSEYNFNNTTTVDSRAGKDAVRVGMVSYGAGHLGALRQSIEIDGNGSDQLAEVPHTLIDPNCDFSIAFWTNINSFSTPEALQYLVTSRHDAAGNEQGGVDISVNAIGEVSCVLRQAVTAISVGTIRSAALTAMTWHYIVVTRKNNTLSLYVDGNLESSATITGAVPVPSHWNFGASYGSGSTIIRELDGRLDEITFYCSALSPAKITSIYTPVNNLASSPDFITNIFPNPVYNQLNLTVEGIDEPLEVQIMTIQGQVLSSQMMQHTTIINTQELPAGVYLVQFRKDQQLLETRKFVKS